MAVRHKSKLDAYIGGGDVIGHKITMFISNTARLALVAIVVGSLLFTITSLIVANHEQRVAARSGLLSVLETGAGVTDRVEFCSPKKCFELPNYMIARHAHEAWEGDTRNPIAKLISSGWHHEEIAALIALLLSLPVFLYGGRFYTALGEKMKSDEYLRGQREVTPEELTRLINNNPLATPSPLTIGGVAIPQEVLPRNIFFGGSMGTGKSQGIMPLLEQARAWGRKMVVYDKTGEFTAKYYRPGIDVILNPVDARCAPWTIYADLKQTTDPAMISRFFVKENERSSDPVWDNSARMLLEDLTIIAWRNGYPMSWIADTATRSSLEQLYTLLLQNECPSTGVINPQNSRGAESVRLTLSATPALRFFKFFDRPADDDVEPFSVRDFVAQPGDGCIFISSSSLHHEAIKPFATAWIEAALMEMMSKDATQDVRLMFFLDELASLSKLPSLDLALTEARKFGIVTIVGIQNLAQFVRLYGREMTQAYVANLQTKLILRVEEDESARRLADTIGKEEIAETSESQSYGAESVRDGVSVNARRTEKHLVTPSQIMTLPDLTGYLKIAGDYPVARVSFPYKKREDKNPALVPRDGLDMTHELDTVGSMEDLLSRMDPESEEYEILSEMLHNGAQRNYDDLARRKRRQDDEDDDKKRSGVAVMRDSKDDFGVGL